MIPFQVIIVPLFLVVSELGLLSDYWGVILPRAAEAFGIFMVRQFMVSIPDELLEAARIDGASELKIFFKIVVPLSKPIIAVLVIFTFMWRWNDFALPLIVMMKHEMYTVQARPQPAARPVQHGMVDDHGDRAALAGADADHLHPSSSAISCRASPAPASSNRSRKSAGRPVFDVSRRIIPWSRSP
jgi:ABC-type glycerol-3-phosphate transport system permease component